MHERLLDKNCAPTPDQIEAHLGEESFCRLLALEEYLRAHYDLTRELRFPFGNNYGWGYKYSHKSSHLCYAFFERGAFTVTIQVGDKQAHLVEGALGELSHKARALWTNRYPCGEHGGWIHDRVMDEQDLADVYRLIHAKKKPR